MVKHVGKRAAGLVAASTLSVLMGAALLSGCSFSQQGEGVDGAGSSVVQAADATNDAAEADPEETSEALPQDVSASEGTGETAKVSQGRFTELEAIAISDSSYTFPIPGADLVAAGWEPIDAIEIESSEGNTMFRLVASCACYHEGMDAYAILLLSNPTDHTVTSLDEAEVVGITIEQGDMADDALVTICDGIKLGDSADRLFEAFGEPRRNNIAGSQHAGSSVTSGTIEWTFQSPTEKEVELAATVDVESNTIIAIDISLSRS